MLINFILNNYRNVAIKTQKQTSQDRGIILMKNVKMQVDLATQLKPKKDGIKIDVGICTGDSLISMGAHRPKKANNDDSHTEYESIIQNNSLETLYMSYENINFEPRSKQQQGKRNFNEILKTGHFGNVLQKKYIKQTCHMQILQNKKMIPEKNNITNLEISILQDSMIEETFRPNNIQHNSSARSGLKRKSYHQERRQGVKKIQQKQKISEWPQKRTSNSIIELAEIKISVDERKLEQTEKMKPKYGVKQYFEEIVKNKQTIQEQKSAQYQKQLMEQYYLKLMNTQYKKSKFGRNLNHQKQESSYSKSKYSFHSGFGFQNSHQRKIDQIKESVEKKKKQGKINFSDFFNPSKWCRNSENLQND